MSSSKRKKCQNLFKVTVPLQVQSAWILFTCSEVNKHEMMKAEVFVFLYDTIMFVFSNGVNTWEHSGTIEQLILCTFE